MEVWTEVLTEDVAVVHFECADYRYTVAVVPLESGMYEHEVPYALDYVAERAVARQFIRESKAMRRDIDQRKRARKRLREAGYDEHEISF